MKCVRSGRNIPGVLQPVVQAGRHGTALYLKWTHVFLCAAAEDVRDGYNTQANAPAGGDTLQLDGTTSFDVVFVDINGGTRRCFLDRHQPTSWPTTDL